MYNIIYYNITILPRSNIIGRIAPRAKNYYAYYNMATPIILYAIILYRRLY